MSAAAPWSVKGIDPKAREIAKDLARREGMTLGEWLNARIMIEGDGDAAPRPNDRRAGSRRTEDLSASEAASRLNAIVSELGERLEEAERRSASAIQNVDQAVSGIVRRMESDREESTRQNRRMDDIARELREGHLRLQRLESTVQDPSRQDGAVSDLRDRLDRAQEATGLALKGLERSFAALDSRIGEKGGVSEERLTQLASSLSQQIEANRLDLMRQIEASTDNTRLARVEQAISQLSAQTRAAEMRSARAVEAMGHEIMRIAQNMNGRMQALENRGGDVSEEAINSRLDQRLADLGRTLDEKLDREISRQSASLDARLTRQEDDHALALERLGGEITRISDRLSERIAQTERRSSQAIDDIGRRLNESAEKFERRHDDVSGELAERLRQSEERTRRLIEEAKEVRAQREAASLNAAPRLTAALPPTDDLTFEPMPVATEAAPESLFASPLDWKPQDAKPGDWRGAAFGSAKSEPLAEAQASPGWADAIAAEMAVEPFPTTDTLRPFGSLDAALDESLEEDSRLLAQATDEADATETAEGEQADAASAERSEDFPSIFASSEHEAQDHSFDVTPPNEAADPLSMTFDAVVDEQPAEEVDPLDAPLKSTRDVIDSARAAIAEEEPAPAIRSAFGLKRKKGGKSVLQEKLDRKASRDGSTLGNALKASALAMLVVGGGGYATLKVVKDQNLNLNFGTDTDPAMAPIAALALDATPAEAVPSAEIASTEGAAVFTRALSLLDSGDPAGVEALRRAAEMGYVPAQMRLASLFTEGGVGVEADPVQAREWTRRAAESGESRAMQHYATQLYDGVGGAADEAGALEWMRKAAEAGRVDAQYNLAHLYENGIKGMKADKVEAFTWYMIAARRGDQQALEAVQRLTPGLSAAERDRARAGADAFNVAPVNG